MTTPIESLVLAALAAVVGGAINSIAGGGTLVTFPMIVALGVSPLTANATNTMALWPGAFGSVYGYRPQFAAIKPLMPAFSAASLLGGVAGGFLLLATGNDRFQAIVPYLVLLATVLFMLQAPVVRWLRARTVPAESVTIGPGFLAAQFAVGVYGGYFGAGIGIMMLAVLGLLGLTDIHQMNALKVWGAWLANMVAGLVFAVSGVVHWPLALAMAVGATLGGYWGSRLAQRVGQVWVRRAVAAIGLAASVWLWVNR